MAGDNILRNSPIKKVIYETSSQNAHILTKMGVLKVVLFANNGTGENFPSLKYFQFQPNEN